MRRLFVLLPLLFILACGDQTVVEPEMAISPAEGLVEVGAKKAGVVKMVPFKMKGDWWRGEGGPPEDCGQFESSFPSYPTWEGTGTHMGHVTGAATNCLEIIDGGAYFLHVQSAEFVAANGDILYARGTAEDDGTQILVHADGAFEIFPVPFVGGTGRFANATGYYHLYGTLAGGPFTANGWISSVGSSK